MNTMIQQPSLATQSAIDAGDAALATGLCFIIAACLLVPVIKAALKHDRNRRHRNAMLRWETDKSSRAANRPARKVVA